MREVTFLSFIQSSVYSTAMYILTKCGMWSLLLLTTDVAILQMSLI